ncbi:MAG: prepilin-type N-terminal cleavage/methylation domain-containing protein [Candidatus Dojkabacteria bacterium]
MTKQRLQQAFTLFELLLSMSLLAMVAAFSVPLYQSFQTSNDLELTADITTQSLRRAQSLAMSGDGDANWGVYIQNGSVTLFQGDDYATRDTSFDEDLEISDKINLSGLSELVYEKFTGDPSATGTINLSIASGETRIITINSRGTVDF